MLPEEAVRRQAAVEVSPEADRMTPRGTLTILLGYLLVIIGLWGYAYIKLILRS
ncbi:MULTISPECIES: hypothetical protein [Limnochorda]|jgi:hypothetical protein|uniref:hypothetical protein n=1 Tax=Limnochorda TaxID=1676651 RepID=UPI00182ABC3A|nr:hypothetical protein [Limnochorda pilosa]NMA71523.1 hypothetical protein [Bacillota bacterium]